MKDAYPNESSGGILPESLIFQYQARYLDSLPV